MSKSKTKCLGPVDPVKWRGKPGQYVYTVFVWHGKPCRKCKRERDDDCDCVWTEVALTTQDADEAERVSDMLCRAGCEACVGRKPRGSVGLVLSTRDFPRIKGTRLRDADKVAKYLKRFEPGTYLRLLVVTDEASCFANCGPLVRVDNGFACQLHSGLEWQTDLRFVSGVQQLSAEEYMHPRRQLVYELATRLRFLEHRQVRLRAAKGRRRVDVEARRRVAEDIKRVQRRLAQTIQLPVGV